MFRKSVVTVRKQAADVSQGGGTQQSVHHRVGQHAGIGVAVQPPVIGDVDTAQDQGTAGGEPVDIVAVAHAQIRHLSRPRRMASAISRSRGW